MPYERSDQFNQSCSCGGREAINKLMAAKSNALEGTALNIHYRHFDGLNNFWWAAWVGTSLIEFQIVGFKMQKIWNFWKRGVVFFYPNLGNSSPLYLQKYVQFHLKPYIQQSCLVRIPSGHCIIISNNRNVASWWYDRPGWNTNSICGWEILFLF